MLIAAISGAAPEQVFADGEPAFTETALATTGPLRPALEQGIRYAAEHRQPTLMAWADAITAAAAGGPLPASGSVPLQNQTIQVDAPTSVPSDPGRSWPEPSSAPGSATPSNPTGDGQSQPNPIAADLGSLPPPAVPPSAAPSPALPQAGPSPSALPPAGLPPASQPPHQLTPQPLAGHQQTGPTGERAKALPDAGRSGTKTFFAGLGVLLVVAAGVVAFVLRSQSTEPIVGPETVVVGQEAAYVMPDADVVAWEVGGQRTEEPVLLLTPSSTGRVTIRAITADGEETRTVDVSATRGELQIVGPGLIPLGETVELSVTGHSGAGLTWRVAGQDYQLQTLEIRPAEVGVFEVEVSVEGGASGRRTFTVADQTE